MNYSLLSPHLHQIAESANRIIKTRYSLTTDGVVEESITADIPVRFTLHWKTKTHYIACEVSDRPFPRSIKQTFADIVASNYPIRIIIAYPKDTGLNSKDYQDDINQCKKFGIGYLSIDNTGIGQIEYKGISLPLYIPYPSDFKKFNAKIKSNVQDCYDHYLLKGDPDVGLQQLGQIVERLIYTTGEQAKKAGQFTFSNFNPPEYISQGALINAMINENVLDNGILGRCKDFAKDRNSTSHKAKSITEARKIETKLKDNFITGLKILEDLPISILNKAYRVKM